MNRPVVSDGRLAGGPRPALRRRRAVAAARPSARAWGGALHFSVILLILVFVGRAHEVIPGVGALPIANLSVGLVLVLLLTGGYFRRLPVVLATPQVRLAFLLLALGAVSVPFALWPGGAVSSLTTSGKLWSICLILPLAVVSTQQLGTVTRTFAIAAALLVGGYVLEGMLGVEAFTERQTLGLDRNDVALFGAMGIPYALAWGAGARRTRLFGYALAGFIVVGIIATGSRGGFLAMAVVGAAFLVRSRILSVPKKFGIVVAALAVVTLAGSGEYWERVASIFNSPTEDYNFQSREGRIEIWKRGLGYAAQNPITGVGFGNFPVAEGQTLADEGYGVKWSTAHSAYVLVLAELGIPGLVVFLLILSSIARESTRTYTALKRSRGPPGSGDDELASLADATRMAFLAFVVAAVFLSVAYSVALLFLVSVAAILRIQCRRSLAARAVARRGFARSPAR